MRGPAAAESLVPMTILLSDPDVGLVPVHDSGEPLVPVADALGHPRAGHAAPAVRVRASVAERLGRAQSALPAGLRLRVVEGHRSARSQSTIIERYRRALTASDPDLDEGTLHRLASRFVAPLDVAPHVAGAAVDLTVADDDGDLDLGTAVDATPEDSRYACYTAATWIPEHARRNRVLLARAMTSAGFVNYPTEWWHWSYGDRYWALVTGAPAASFGPLDDAS